MGEIWIDGVSNEGHIIQDAGVKEIQDPYLISLTDLT